MSLPNPNQPPDQGEAKMKEMVDRFLRWPLPKSVRCDPCATMTDYAFERTGTNLLTFTEARQMLEHVILSAPLQLPVTKTGRTTEDAISEANWLLGETFNGLDPDNDHDGWLAVRITKIKEALADRPPLSPLPLMNGEMLDELRYFVNTFNDLKATPDGTREKFMRSDVVKQTLLKAGKFLLANAPAIARAGEAVELLKRCKKALSRAVIRSDMPGPIEIAEFGYESIWKDIADLLAQISPASDPAQAGEGGSR